MKINTLKKLAIMAVASAVCCHLSAEEGFVPLFNGQNLEGWHSMAEKKVDGAGAFFVDQAEKAIHPYAGKEADSKQDIDCLHTTKEYSHFILKLEYKWLDKRFAPRTKEDRDAGVLFHIHGDLETIWPNCVEMQMGNSDVGKTKDRYTTGDLWVIGKDVQAMNSREGKFYSAKAAPVPVGKDLMYDMSFVPVQNEKPLGEWNEITLTVRGGEEAIFELNGKVVNRIGKMTHEVDGKRVPLQKGRIGLQAEYAELMYRNIRIKELNPDAGPAESAPPAIYFLSDSIVDDKALVTPVGPRFAGAMNGLSYQNDILVSHNGWQYTAWYDTVGTDQSVWLARRSILGPASGKWEKFDSGSDLLNADEDSWDTHNNISLGISKADGTLHLSWDHHVHDLRYRRSLPGLATYADSDWNASRILAEQNWLTSSASPVTDLTYPVFISTPEDTLLFNFRTAGSSNGSNWLAAWQPATENYAPPILVTVKDGIYTGLSNKGGDFTSKSRNAYANGFDFGPDGRLHYTWTWRESVVPSNHDICYAYSPDRGVKWYNNAGTLIADTSQGQRIQLDTPGTVVVPLNCRQQLINQQSQCVDDQGRVHVLVCHRRQEPGFEWALGDEAFEDPDTAYFHYHRDPATGNWTGSRLPVTHPVGSRPDVETLPNGDIYTVFRSDKRLVVAAATAAAHYTDWTILTTYGSNFRGVPRLDHTRMRKSGVLSVYLSEDAPPSSSPTGVPLHVIDFATGSLFEAHAGQDQRVKDEDNNGFQEVNLTAAVGASPGLKVQSQRWLHQGKVVSTQADLTISLPVGSHTLTHEATSDGGLVSADNVVVTVK
jgi:hypothetical protein